MPSIKDLKKRIGSVKNTQQTTKAMKMVSAAKLRRAQEAITSQRPYARGLERLIQTLVTLPQVEFSSPLVSGEGSSSVSEKSLLLVIVTSDRGLCGGFNANVIKAAQRWIAQNKGLYQRIDLSFVGKKANDFFKNKNFSLGPSFVDYSGKVTFFKARSLAHSLIEQFEAGEYQEVKFIYNEFKNAVTQRAVVEDYLPLDSSKLVAQPDESGALVSPMIIVKPSHSELIAQLLKKNFVVQSHRILLESQAGEHGARMSAMENATKNAGEMIKKLTLQYNKQRQAGITKELLEIIAGSESQKSQ